MTFIKFHFCRVSKICFEPLVKIKTDLSMPDDTATQALVNSAICIIRRANANNFTISVVILMVNTQRSYQGLQNNIKAEVIS
jgi:hypothetical protein